MSCSSAGTLSSFKCNETKRTSAHSFSTHKHETTRTCTMQVRSTNLEEWGISPRYPDFVAGGTGDQKAIMGAICAVKKASFDGVDCVGGDDTATGTVRFIGFPVSPS